MDAEKPPRAGSCRSAARRGTTRTRCAAACGDRWPPSSLRQVVLALAAADDLAVTLGREHVHVERQRRVGRVVLEVERLQLHRVAVHDDRAVELPADDRLLVAAEVVAHLRLGVTVLLQDVDRLFVSNARKRRLDRLEFRGIALQRFDLARPIAQDRLHDMAHQSFAERHHVFQVRVSCFGFQHPEFGQVPARFRFLGAKGWPEAINFAQRRGQRFHVELPRLGQVSLLVVDVLHFKQSCRALAGSRRKYGCIRERVTLAVHEFARGADGFGANSQDGGLAWSTHPQMPPVEKKIHAVLF